MREKTYYKLHCHKSVWGDTYLATALVILLIWACHLSWSSRTTPRWRCSETCSITCEFNMGRRGGRPHWCFCRVATTTLLVFSGLSNSAVAERHSVTSWMLICSLVLLYLLYYFQKLKETNHQKYVTINFSRWNTQQGIIYVNIGEKRSKNRPCGTPTSTQISGE